MSDFIRRTIIMGTGADFIDESIIEARASHCDDGHLGGECCRHLRTAGETRCRNFSIALKRTCEGVERAIGCVHRERMYKLCLLAMTVDRFRVIRFEWVTKAGAGDVEVVEIAPAEADGSRLIVKWAKGASPSVSDWNEKGSGERDKVIREVLEMVAEKDARRGMSV